MSDDAEPDRLEQIARRFARGDETPDDVEWLLADDRAMREEVRLLREEVRRLREEVRRLREELAEDARPFGASEP